MLAVEQGCQYEIITEDLYMCDFLTLVDECLQTQVEQRSG